MSMSVKRMIESDNREHTINGYARGVYRDQDHRLLLVLVWVLGISFTHHNIDLAPLVTSTTAPPRIR
jgi:hypothetical protein